MEKIGEVIDKKFDEALRMMIEDDTNSVITSKPIMGSSSELIGLDCENEQPNRYIISRPCLDGRTVGFDFGYPDIGEVNCTSWLFKIPRNLGDKRKMENLPIEAFHGGLYLIDEKKEIVIDMSIIEPLGRRAIISYCYELSGLRVIENIPLPEL